MYRSLNTVRVIKYRRLRWAGHAARMEEGMSAFKILTSKPSEKRNSVRIVYLYFPPSSHLLYVGNVVITTKGLQDRNIHIIYGTTVENKGKLILTI